MKTLSPDTHPDAERVLIELLRKAPSWKKCQQVSEMIKMCRSFSVIGLKSRYPKASLEELHRRLAALWLPREWVIRVYLNLSDLLKKSLEESGIKHKKFPIFRYPMIPITNYRLPK